VVFDIPTNADGTTPAIGLDWTDDFASGVNLGTGDQATRTYTAALGLANTEPVLVDARQTVTADPTASETRSIKFSSATPNATVVGPVLGVGINDGAQTLDYGSTIDLGDLDIGESGSQELAIGNIFGTDISPQLTNLTIGNVALDDDFDGRFSILGAGCSGSNPYDNNPNDVVATGDFTAAGICLSFDPGTRPSFGEQTGANQWTATFNTVLRFFTDMNRPYQDTGLSGAGGLYGVASSGADLNFFGIELTATYDYTPTGVPTPGALALVGLGLAGLAGLRARRRWVAGRVGGGA
jgi:hypothetical protein